jgi:hypothetical protein
MILPMRRVSSLLLLLLTFPDQSVAADTQANDEAKPLTRNKRNLFIAPDNNNNRPTMAVQQTNLPMAVFVVVLKALFVASRHHSAQNQPAELTLR